uniref:FGENESH: predicted gene_3.409 protein n=1 Tax=Rhodotorula toruloides TaxID=5286 RepID=A0A0K3CBT1_RHOTO
MIVEKCQEKDVVWQQMLRSHGHADILGVYEDKPWSKQAWRGRSVSALSLVSRRVRVAALPFLVKVGRSTRERNVPLTDLAHQEITSAKFRSPEFRLGKMAPALLEAISHVSLLDGRSEQLVEIILALPLLPSAAKLSVSDSLFTSSSYHGLYSLSTNQASATSSETTVQAFVAAIAHIPHIVLKSARSGPGLHKMLRLVTENVRHLEVRNCPYSLKSAVDDSLFEYLIGVANLEVLIIAESRSFATSLLQDLEVADVFLLRLKILEIEAEELQHLHVLARRAPCLVQLRLTFHGNVGEMHDSTAEIPATFVRLTSLTLYGHRQITRLLPLFETSPLRHLRIELQAANAVLDAAPDLFSSDSPVHLPPSLSLVSLGKADVLPPDDYSNFARRVAKRGIALQSDWPAQKACNLGANAAGSDGGLTGGADASSKVDELAKELLEIVEWAEGRAEWAAEIKDEDALAQLEWAFRKTRMNHSLRRLTTRQLTSPLYRLNRLPAGLTQSTDHVVWNSLGFDSFVTLAAALPYLAAPRTLEFDLVAANEGDFRYRATKEKFVLSEFRQETMSITCVILRNFKPERDTTIIAPLLASPATVTNLAFEATPAPSGGRRRDYDPYDTPSTPQQLTFRQLLLRFQHLHTLTFDHDSRAGQKVLALLSREKLAIPSLRELRIEVAQIGDVPDLNHLAPRLHRLYLSFDKYAHCTHDDLTSPTNLFRHIRHLELRGSPEFSTALRYFSTSPLTTLTIHIVTSSVVQDDLFASQMSFELPPKLQDVNLHDPTRKLDDAGRLAALRRRAEWMVVLEDDEQLRKIAEAIDPLFQRETLDRL